MARKATPRACQPSSRRCFPDPGGAVHLLPSWLDRRGRSRLPGPVSADPTPSRFPPWLRSLGWVVFVLWFGAAGLMVVRWWLMNGAHRRAQAIMAVGRPAAPAGLPGSAGEGPASAPPEVPRPRGTPAGELPLIGPILRGDQTAAHELEKTMGELRDFLQHLASSRVDGAISFRLWLSKQGERVPDSMTEAEAAALFLEKAKRFSGLLAEWRAAVERGPWDFTGHPAGHRWSVGVGHPLFLQMGRLLAATVEAQWRTGDPAAAWEGLTTMRMTGARVMDDPSLFAVYISKAVQVEMIQAFRAGIQLGTLTDGQLAEVPSWGGQNEALSTMRRGLEGEKARIAADFARAQENRDHLAMRFYAPGAYVTNFVNQLGASLTTDQQLADNLAVMHQTIDQSLARFDPVTGRYQPPQAGEPATVPAARPSDSWFDSFYFMYADTLGVELYARIPQVVIETQSTLDHARLAAALELHQRATGQYPDSLDAVSGTFPDGLPRDLAAGQPYLYQRAPEGGYTLWGAGVDGTSQGGTFKSDDVVWHHEPTTGP
jgi:hypothetical protein